MNQNQGLVYEFLEGEGAPLVFLHGWLGSRESWSQVREYIDLENPKLFYDQRCHGKSESKKFDFEGLSNDLKRLIEKLGLDKPILVGHSMGGMVALKYAAEGNDLGGIFLLGTCASTPEPENRSPIFFLKNLGTMNREEWSERIVENYASETDFPEVKKMAKKELMEADDTVLIYGLGAMISYDLRVELEVDAPSKVVHGEKDGAITGEKSRELAELLDCELEKIDATHLMLQEKPEQIAEMLEEFVEDEIK